MTSFLSDLRLYVGRIHEFERVDWAVYLVWVGLMLGLVGSTGGFLLLGHVHGVRFPAVAWLVPAGAAVFAGAIAVDTIGHRTVYKEALRGAEALVHHVTIFAGIGSCVLLVAAYPQRAGFAVPAMVLTGLSVVYSLVDEVFHWRRYATQRSDRVEMWSHVFILTGHGIMMVGWWSFYAQGYPGVAETLAVLA
jgi:hypothetical protein